MLKIGIIGLGDIAAKAYLPVLSTRKTEVHLYTRNKDVLMNIAGQYRFQFIHDDLDALIKSGIQGAFVHSATSAHYEIIEKLLGQNIHVYADKPITYDYASTEKLFELARKNGRILFTGFNRRYAPAIQKLRELSDLSMIIMQKNRKTLPADIRTFIFDDFIHVVDTLLYLFPYPVKELVVSGKKNGSMLYHVTIQCIAANGVTAIGIMNRDSGTVEEKLEVFTSVDKWVVNNVTETIICRDKNELKVGVNDWESTLYKRGFEQMVDEFLGALQSGNHIQEPDPRITHEICEEIVQRLTVL